MSCNYDVNIVGSRVYDDDEGNRTEYGGLYTYDQAIQAGFCPPGWHLPTLAEWMTLINYLGGLTVAAGLLKEEGNAHWTTNVYTPVSPDGCFKAFGGGAYGIAGGLYNWLQIQGYFLTATESTPGFAHAILMNFGDIIAIDTQVRSGIDFCSLRLIKDTPVYIGNGALYNWYTIAQGLLSDQFFGYTVGALAGQGDWSSDGYGFDVILVSGDKKLTCETGSGGDLYLWTDRTVNTDQFSEITISKVATAETSAHYIGVSVRSRLIIGIYNGFVFSLNTDGDYYIRYWVGGGYTDIITGSTGVSLQAGDKIRLEIEGDELRCYFNGVLFTGFADEITGIFDVTGLVPVGGTPGFDGYTDGTSYVIQIESFIGGDLHRRNIAPTGWRIPTDDDWIILENAIMAEYSIANLTFIGSVMSEIGNTHWNYLYGTNETDFKSFGSGVRQSDGGYNLLKEYAFYHSIEPFTYYRNIEQARFYYMNEWGPLQKTAGLSVRCLMDGVDPDDPGTVTDYDGNVYQTVKIGTQVWMATSLKTEHYNDGTPIPIVTDDASWAALTTDAMCYYNNTP
jgi:uncharacterized protein (TIGR02145 family)